LVAASGIKWIWKLINEVIDRWAQIMPKHWNVQRTAQVQTLSALDRIAHYLNDKLQAQPFRPAYSLLALIQRMQANNNFNRDATLAKVGNLRGLLPPADITEMATVIQAEFIRAGAQYIGNAVIFPGGSIQRLLATQLPFDTLQLNRLKHLGIEVETWLRLPAATLFDLTRSSEWQTIRTYLRQPSLVEEEEILMNYQYFFKQFNQKRTVNKIKPAPVILPAPWTLASQALLGSNALTAAHRQAHAKTFILNLDSRLLVNSRLPEIQVRLEKSQTELLTLLMINAESGLAVEYIKQLELELDLLKHANGHWCCQTQQPSELDKARLNRVNVLKTRTNQKLKSFGLKIAVYQGHWSLVAIDGSEVTFELAGNAWERFQSKEQPARPSGLSKQLARLWDYLWNCSPHFVHAEALATVLGSGHSLKQVSDAIYKLEKYLSQEQWLIVHNYLGEYALIPKLFHPEPESSCHQAMVTCSDK